MSGFLDEMAAVSWARVHEAQAKEPIEALRARALATPTPPSLRLGAFSLIAEVKLHAPSVGELAAPISDRLGFVTGQALRYEAAGAHAISVLTEPSRFKGELSDLQAVAGALQGIPAMRKDFLVHPYQLWEARLVGAGGALLIARMLDDEALNEMLAVAQEAGLFVLLEAFDEEDLRRCREVAAQWPASSPPLMVGVNTRDLSTLQVDEHRLSRLASSLPAEVPGVAESGMATPADVGAAASMGYTVALVGSALMTADDPRALAAAMLEAGGQP